MKSNLRRKSFALVATAAMLVASFFVVQHARGESAKPSAPEVKIDNFTFTVPSVTVAAGTEAPLGSTTVPMTLRPGDEVWAIALTILNATSANRLPNIGSPIRISS